MNDKGIPGRKTLLKLRYFNFYNFSSMDKKKFITGTEIVIGAALLIFITYGIYLRYFVGSEAFQEYAREDGPVECTTAFFLFFSSLVCVYRLFQYRKMKKRLWLLTWVVLAILFFFGAGDEISWGQRIFGIESGDFFLKHNKQAETNLHNLVIKGHSLNVIIFSRLLFAVLIIYFFLSRLMVWKIPFIRNLVYKFQVPLPKMQHIIIMAVATVMVLSIQLIRDSELHELTFALVFFLIFINPARINKE